MEILDLDILKAILHNTNFKWQEHHGVTSIIHSFINQLIQNSSVLDSYLQMFLAAEYVYSSLNTLLSCQ